MLTAFVIISSFKSSISMDLVRAIASIVSCGILLKMFDWLRLFEGIAFYILLLEQTLKDISNFLILIVFALSMFGIPLIILNQNRTDENSLIDNPVNFWVIDMLINQYLLALGEFNTSNFTSGP